MRLLLVNNSSYFPSCRGASRSDRLMMTALARRGHSCRVVARIDEATEHGHREYVSCLNERGITPKRAGTGVVTLDIDSVDVHVVTTANIRAYALNQLGEFKPDVVLVSTDPLNVLVADLIREKAKRVVYLVRTTTLLPFGPDAAFPSKVKTEAIRSAAAVVAVSRYLVGYVWKHARMKAVHLPIQLMEVDDWPALGDFDNPLITMVNPCAVKGISIFLGLADFFPGCAFAAVPTWGTTSGDRADLVRRPNIRLLDPVDDVRELLRQTRVTLVPSLWAEGRGRIVVESMLSGVPVLASDRGGISEAVLGLTCLLAVNPITRYEDRLDELGIRIPEVPPQPLRPWQEALGRLITDRDHYTGVSRKSRELAKAYASDLDIASFESLMNDLLKA